MTLEQRTDHTGTTSNCLVACPFCDTELENGRQRIEHLQTCEERPK
jgi:hypothetical protein